MSVSIDLNKPKLKAKQNSTLFTRWHTHTTQKSLQRRAEKRN